MIRHYKMLTSEQFVVLSACPAPNSVFASDTRASNAELEQECHIPSVFCEALSTVKCIGNSQIPVDLAEIH